MYNGTYLFGEWQMALRIKGIVKISSDDKSSHCSEENSDNSKNRVY